jgi:choline dehydrogenase-like flavoprotein
LVKASVDDHSTKGNLDLTYGQASVPDVGDIFKAAEQTGHRINQDVNNRDPMGMGIGSVCITRGARVMFGSTYLSRPPPNLKIIVETPVARVLFVKKRTSGVECIDGRRLTTRKTSFSPEVL